MQPWLSAFLVWGLYPAWLLAGAGDYLCHRRTDIEHTSGVTESWLHFLQLICVAIPLAVAALLEVNAVTFAVMVAFVLAHSILSLVDVSYTESRRSITPIEQAIHGFMDVLPVVAVALIGVSHWTEIRTSPVVLAMQGPVSSGQILLLASFLLLAGTPVVEELLRTLRAERRSELRSKPDA